jgi:hypothetical protein
VAWLALAALHPATATTKKPPLYPINIKSASSAELQQASGIGPSTPRKNPADSRPKPTPANTAPKEDEELE